MSNLGRWEPWYADKDFEEPEPYGADQSYLLAEEWLHDLAVEDWGCGSGYFRVHHKGDYLGIDGTPTPFVDRVEDLADYVSETEGLLLRHVLEHNPQWERVLANAVASFTRRLVVVLFTPTGDKTEVLEEDVGGLGVPDISFRLEDLTDRIPGVVMIDELDSPHTAYGVETLIKAER